ncbi:hypothetical protein C0993_007405 [Termitomyces sp. T159_Od127]|nr:hypothetical protein C0993_007405 [Termitomyces sp. T159_Od127]
MVIQNLFLGTKKKNFTRALVDGDWERFNYYASMIRVLKLGQRVGPSIGEDADVYIHLDVFAALQGYSDRKGVKCLVPNLREAILAYYMDESFIRDSVPHLRCLLPQGLRSFFFEDPHSGFVQSKDACEAVASLIIQSCSNIVDFGVGSSTFFDSIDNSHLLKLQLPKLENIYGCLGSTRKEAIRHLGSLPSLKSIQVLSLEKDTDMTSFATADGLFKSMERLKLGTLSGARAAALFNSMRCRFRELDIKIPRPTFIDERLIGEIIPDSHHLQDLTSTLTSNAFLRESLKTFKISDARGGYKLYADSELPPSTFQPLLSLRALQHVILRLVGLEHLNDAWLEEAAIAWPDLRTLIINETENCFSLKGLIPLLKNCRRITTLELYPTASHFDLSVLPADGGASNTNVTGIFSLHKVEGDKMDPDALFACLTSMFPNVRGVKIADINSVSFDEEYEEKWEILEQRFKEKFPSLSAEI